MPATDRPTAEQILDQVKTMMHELATDELSRETLIWTCQHKLDAHMARIAAILAVLDTGNSENN